jgi:hypothetical protein
VAWIQFLLQRKYGTTILVLTVLGLGFAWFAHPSDPMSLAIMFVFVIFLFTLALNFMDTFGFSLLRKSFGTYFFIDGSRASFSFSFSFHHHHLLLLLFLSFLFTWRVCFFYSQNGGT